MEKLIEERATVEADMFCAACTPTNCDQRRKGKRCEEYMLIHESYIKGAKWGVANSVKVKDVEYLYNVARAIFRDCVNTNGATNVEYDMEGAQRIIYGYVKSLERIEEYVHFAKKKDLGMALKEHGNKVIDADGVELLCMIFSDNMVFVEGRKFCSFKHLFLNYTFPDGSVIGEPKRVRLI